ncbi:MAG: hypothetical protein MMC23_003144 [Stictis urceolatum]|nr:hypothetical protein [Stictis urceolata]
MRKQSSASSISIAIDSADEDAMSALEEAVEETISRPSLSSDRTSGSFRSSRPVSPLTPTLPAADAPTVTPRPPSPANSARPTSPTCSVRPVSPTQFVITSTPRQSSPVPSTHTSKTVFSIPEDSSIQHTTTRSSQGSTSEHSTDGTRPLSPTSTRTTVTTATAAARVGSMPTFPSRHEAKKARKAYLAAQAEAKRQSAKMGVEGILGWDAGKRAWVCKMSDEEKRKWLEKWTDGKGLVGHAGSGGGEEGDSRGKRRSVEWGRGVNLGIGVGRGREGAVEVGLRGLGVKVVDVQ